MDWNAIDSDGNDIGADTDSDYDSDDYTVNNVMVLGQQRFVEQHSGQIYYKCPVDGCHRIFVYLRLLQLHALSKHTKGRKPFKCACGKKYTNAMRLANHKKYNMQCVLFEAQQEVIKNNGAKK